jgi:hypothetical protein
MPIEAVYLGVPWTARRRGSSIGYVQLQYELYGVGFVNEGVKARIRSRTSQSSRSSGRLDCLCELDCHRDSSSLGSSDFGRYCQQTQPDSQRRSHSHRPVRSSSHRLQAAQPQSVGSLGTYGDVCSCVRSQCCRERDLVRSALQGAHWIRIRARLGFDRDVSGSVQENRAGDSCRDRRRITRPYERAEPPREAHI